MTDDKNWTRIQSYTTLQEAAIARGMLDSHGITAIIPEDIMSGSVYPMTLTWTSIDLLVPTSQADEARRLLDIH